MNLKILISAVSLLLAAWTHAQTNLSAVMVNGAGVVQRPTNFFTANDLVSLKGLQLGDTQWTPSVPYLLATTNSGTNAYFADVADVRRLRTQDGAGSIFVNLNTYGQRFVRGNAPFGIQWDQPVWLIVVAGANIRDDAVGRIQLGGRGWTQTTIGSLTMTSSIHQGMGLIMSNGQIFVEATHGLTNRTVSSNVLSYDTDNNGGIVNIKLRSSGTNSIAVYTNNVLHTNLPFGPTVPTSNTGQAWNVSIDSGTSTNLNFIDISSTGFQVFLE